MTGSALDRGQGAQFEVLLLQPGQSKERFPSFTCYNLAHASDCSVRTAALREVIPASEGAVFYHFPVEIVSLKADVYRVYDPEASSSKGWLRCFPSHPVLFIMAGELVHVFKDVIKLIESSSEVSYIGANTSAPLNASLFLNVTFSASEMRSDQNEYPARPRY